MQKELYSKENTRTKKKLYYLQRQGNQGCHYSVFLEYCEIDTSFSAVSRGRTCSKNRLVLSVYTFSLYFIYDILCLLDVICTSLSVSGTSYSLSAWELIKVCAVQRNSCRPVCLSSRHVKRPHCYLNHPTYSLYHFVFCIDSAVLSLVIRQVLLGFYRWKGFAWSYNKWQIKHHYDHKDILLPSPYSKLYSWCFT